MSPDRLQLFFQDEFTREDFKQFQLKVLEEMVLKDCFENGGKDSQALAKNKELIETSYRRLHDLFGRINKPVNHDPR